MKFLFTSAILLAVGQANANGLRSLQDCPAPGTGITCTSDVSPVACGTNYACEYSNDCLANAAGFVGCLPVDEVCPTPGSGVICSADNKPVLCGTGFKCEYANECLANAAGFVGCLLKDPECPLPGTGIACQGDVKNVICNGCPYDNECLANAAGFAVESQCNIPPPPCNPTTTANCPVVLPPPTGTNPPLPPCTPTTTTDCSGTPELQTTGTPGTLSSTPEGELNITVADDTSASSSLALAAGSIVAAGLALFLA